MKFWNTLINAPPIIPPNCINAGINIEPTVAPISDSSLTNSKNIGLWKAAPIWSKYGKIPKTALPIFSIVGAIESPSLIILVVILVVNLSHVGPIPWFIVLKALSVAPIEFFIASRSSANPFAPSPVNDKATCAASTLPKSSFIPFPDFLALSSKIFKAPWRSPPFAIKSLKDPPVAFWNSFETLELPWDNSEKAAFNCVIATSVGVPFAVILANAAVTSLNCTPKLAARGPTLEILPAISPNVVFPSLTAVNIKSLACAAVIFFSPQAFTTEDSPSTAVDTSETPATAPFWAVSKKVMTLSWDTPADNAWYNAGTVFSGNTPNLFDRSKISFLSLAISGWVIFGSIVNTSFIFFWKPTVVVIASFPKSNTALPTFFTAVIARSALKKSPNIDVFFLALSASSESFFNPFFPFSPAFSAEFPMSSNSLPVLSALFPDFSVSFSIPFILFFVFSNFCPVSDNIFAAWLKLSLNFSFFSPDFSVVSLKSFILSARELNFEIASFKSTWTSIAI